MSPLNITHHATTAGPVLHVAGELDHHHATALRHHLDHLALNSGQCMVIDLSALEFCDSTGITALLAARRHAHGAGADIALAAVPANLLRILTIVGLDQVFTIVPSADTV